MADVAKLESELKKVGLWDICVDGRFRHRYQLTDGVFRLSDTQRTQLDDIGRCVQQYQSATVNFCQYLGRKHREGLSGLESKYYRALKASCGGYPLRLNESAVSPLVKVDLMWDGDCFKIAEVDTYNPRGLAFLLLIRHVHVQAGEEKAKRPELIEALRQLSGGSDIIWLYSSPERYYRPVMEVAASILTDSGISTRVVGEESVESVAQFVNNQLHVAGKKLLIVPDRMNQNIELRDSLCEFAQVNPELVVIPYGPHLGSKLLLSVLTGDRPLLNRDVPMTSILPEDSVGLIDRYIPRATALGKGMTHPMNRDGCVLKEIASSGTKGVYMPDDSTYGKVLVEASGRKNLGIIAQDCVKQQQVDIAGVKHYIRVTAYVDATTGKMIDAVLTGTGDNLLVHGGANCIQLPVIF